MSVLGFSRTFSSPYATGTAASILVPHKFDVAIDGRGYMLDRKMLAKGDMSLISSIRATRTQSDGSQEPGEQSLNPDDLWRRTQQSWHFGAGQNYLDREDSDRRRFRQSKGIDCWTEGQLALLNATTESLNASGTNLRLMPAGARLYAVDGTALKYTTDGTNWSTTTGTSGSSITGIASDGFYVWVTDGANVYRTNTGTTSAASWSTEDLDTLGYVKGRLFGSDANDLMYASDIATPTFTSLFAHANTNFVWVGFAEGPAHVYAAGYVGDKSTIYRIALTREGTSLDAPTVAGELPDGEVIYSIASYVGFIFLGTSKGARFCTLDGQGNLVIGKLIETSNPVRCFEGQEEFVWFGYTNYDGTSTGLGRMSLKHFSDVEAQRPAYATDLMVTSTADVQDVVTFLGIRFFAVSGDGFYKEDTANLVASGIIDCGRFNYGITEKKIPLYLDVTFQSGFAGSCASYFAVDGSSDVTLIATHATTATDLVTVTHAVSEDPVNEIEIRQVFSRGTPSTAGPVLLRHTVRSQPVPLLRRRITLPLVLHDKVKTNAGTDERYDVSTELAVIEGWRITKQVVAVQIGSESYAAALDDFDFVAMQETRNRSFWQGTSLTMFKTV